MTLIYRIENDPREDCPRYDGLGLPACKARARRLSAKSVNRLVYIIAARWNSGAKAYEDCGHILFADGRQESTEGEV